MGQLTASDFQSYDPSDAGSIAAGPFALYAVSLSDIVPTQLSIGDAEVDNRASSFDLYTTASEVENYLLTEIEPVVIGPGGTLYLLNGHHTLTALEDSVWGSDPNVNFYVDVIANFSGDTTSQFWSAMEQDNLLLAVDNGTPETVDTQNGTVNGAPFPTSFTSLPNDPYRGLEYDILKEKDSKLFAGGASTPGLDKMTGFYSDFLEADAYRGADSGNGLPYLSPGDVALATNWNLTGSSTTTLPNVSGTVHAYQLPGFILTQNLVEGGGITNATLGNAGPGPSMQGALDGNGTFTGITEINTGSTDIGTPNVGFIMQLGGDKGFSVTLNGSNSYTGGTSILAGTLIIAGDSSLGAAPTESNSAFYSSLAFNAAGFPDNVTAAVQADNGIIFNSLSEGNGTLVIGTTPGGGTSAFSTSRPIAVGGEAANLNLNGYLVTLSGPIISLGQNSVGTGNQSGESDLTIEDTSSSANGVLILPSTDSNPYFYGNWIISSGTLRVSNDASLGNTTGAADTIGQIELNGGTLQAGANFSSVRSVSVQSKSTFDTGGFATSFGGALSDNQRNLTITNSDLPGSSGAGSVTFGSFQIGSALELTVSKGSGTSTAVIFTNGISQTSASDQLLLAGLSSHATISDGSAPTLTNGIVAPWIVIDSGASSNPYDFATYGGSGFTTFSSYATDITTSSTTQVVKQSSNATLSANAQAYALNLQNGDKVTITGHTLTLGNGAAAGLILNGGSGSGLIGGTLAFGTAEAYVTVTGSPSTGNAISSIITGSGGLSIDGTGTVTISAASTESGLVTVNSGTLALSATNVFSGDAQGVLLQDTKNLAKANLTLNNSNQFAALSSAGNNSTVTIASGSVLTIGDTINNLSSTLSSAITETGSAVTGALTVAGTGMLDLSGMSSGKLSLVSGSTVAVTGGGTLRIQANIFANAPTITLSNNSELQFAENGGDVFSGTVSGTGSAWLIGGVLKVTGAGSLDASGGAVVQDGSTLDVTTASFGTAAGAANITDAGGLIVFDQDTSGAYSGVIGDGREMGTGPMLSGSLDIDDSAGTNASADDVTLNAVQTFTGAAYVEAGTLTLAVANAIADSSGLTLGRVGGAVNSQTANLVLGADNALAGLSDNASNTTSVTLNGHTLTIDPAAGTSSSYSGTIGDGSGHGSVVVGGTGTVALGGDNTFSGGVTIDDGATLVLGSANAAGTGAITFVGDPTLVIDGSTMPTNDIDGFVAGDKIDLASIGNVAGSHVDMNYATNVLTITEGSSTYTLNFNPTENFAGDYFSLAPDNGGAGPGTEITESSVACYCRGTLIATERGEVAVEDVAIGDRVVTRSGALRPIKWIGRRSYAGRFVMGRSDMLPVCIKAGALADNMPRRDLWISPNHSMYFENEHGGVLIEARDLINGASIVQAERVEKLEYFHVELASHDVIVAEGALSETFIDDDSRGIFHNAHEYRLIEPDAATGPAQYCALRLGEGHAVEVVRRRIALRAGLRRQNEMAGRLRGFVDLIRPGTIEGWAQDLDYPEAPVCLDIYAGDILLGQVLADRYRKDLADFTRGSGRHSFQFTPPAGLAFAAHSVSVRRSLDGTALKFSRQARAA